LAGLQSDQCACRQTDSLIQDTLHAAVKGPKATVERIMLVIAHRVGTIMSCDQLLVLSDGRLVEKGPPRPLAEGDGVFGRLVAAAAANERRGEGAS
jgi:ABC-type multidrug transport system fused ATPase/permease subunit